MITIQRIHQFRGYASLLKAISDKLKRDNGLEYATNQIIVSNGAKHSIANLLQCLINKGDEVIIPGALLGDLH